MNMNIEEMNQKIRTEPQNQLASASLQSELLERHAKRFGGNLQTPIDDLLQAIRAAATTLTKLMDKPQEAGVWIDTESAKNIIFSMSAIPQGPQRSLLPSKQENREAIRRMRDAHDHASRIAVLIQGSSKKTFTYEDLKRQTETSTAPRAVLRLLTSKPKPTGLTLLGETKIRPIKLKVKTLPCSNEFILKLNPVSIPESGLAAQVRISGAEDSDAAGLKGLIGRELPLSFTRHGQCDVIRLCLDLSKIYGLSVDARVTVTRAIRAADFHLNMLELIEIENPQLLVQQLRQSMPVAQESMLQTLNTLIQTRVG